MAKPPPTKAPPPKPPASRRKPPRRPVLRLGQNRRLLRPAETLAAPFGFDDIRLSATEAHEALAAAADRFAPPPSRRRGLWAPRHPVNLLAVSGGASGGAFGAGLLVGLSRVGRRPDFAIVTGVSTGALIAPFAFLGSAWDARLTEAFTGGHAQRLLGLRGWTPGVGAGLLRAEALDALIRPFVDQALMEAVAAAHDQGRRLFVATTDLDRQQACIWDMGAIARHAALGAATGDTDRAERALNLFRLVMAASSSLPGVFPPRLIDCESDGQTYQEMHVDGGVATPLFLLPEALLRWRRIGQRLRRGLSGGRVYVIANTVLEPTPRRTPAHLPAILLRSFDTMLRFSYRQAITVTATFCAGAGLPMDIASIPRSAVHGSMVSFDTASMKSMYDAAIESAAGPDAWTSVAPEPDGFGGVFTWPSKAEK